MDRKKTNKHRMFFVKMEKSVNDNVKKRLLKKFYEGSNKAYQHGLTNC